MAVALCLGELLVDLHALEQDRPLEQVERFEVAPGGAPANVAVALRRLGVAAGFVGAVGADAFGERLADVLRGEGVDLTGLRHVEGVRTTLAFIARRSDGTKDILFYRHPGADGALCAAHIDALSFDGVEALHFGSISRIDAGPREATDRARARALEQGALVSYDPNVRPDLWPDLDGARERLLEGFDGSTLAKVSDEEWSLITGTADFDDGVELLLDRGVELVVRSEGPLGSSWATPRSRGHVEAFDVECVEPTGAGDAAAAALIAGLLPFWRRGRPPAELDDSELRDVVTRANAAGAVACTRLGAIPALPTAAELEALLRYSHRSLPSSPGTSI